VLLLQVWDIIEKAKLNRAIILTTHSMEEADILGDKVAIMAKGNLRCLNTTLRLKQKFGAGYQARSAVATVDLATPAAVLATQ
jgi:ABC-type multidrug transport system ATPase subunit